MSIILEPDQQQQIQAALNRCYNDCTEALRDALGEPACPVCEDTGEVLSESTRAGSMLIPCPQWCEQACRLYDDRDDRGWKD